MRILDYEPRPHAPQAAENGHRPSTNLEAPADAHIDPDHVDRQRLDALAQMAGHVAHEYNNLLTTILGFSSLMRQSNDLPADERDNLRHIDDAAHRAADFTQSLLSFARGGLVSYGTIDLNRLVSEALQVARPSLGPIRAHLDLARSTPFIDGDAEQVQLAIVNIILNAGEAMAGDGELFVSVRQPGGGVQVRIADTGPGMDDDTRRRAFEPFFSRDATGARAGLGLSTAYGIVRGHRGSIDVESMVGEGTTVVMTFPVSETPPKRERERALAGDLALIGPADDAMRERATRLAASLGLTPVFTRTMAHAMALVDSRPHRFATAICAGDPASQAQFRAVLELHPGMPLLLCIPVEETAPLRRAAGPR